MVAIRKVNRFYGNFECSADPIFDDLQLPSQLHVIEIGTRYGDTAVSMSKRFNLAHYIAIDPYVDYSEYDGEDFSLHMRRDVNIFKKISKKIMRNMDCPITFLRKFSDDAHAEIEDEWADFVFIDGNHEYEYVLRDLENYWPKVSLGGYLTGHDFWHRSIENGGDFPKQMVYEAVLEFTSKYGLDYNVHGTHGEYPACFSIKKI